MKQSTTHIYSQEDLLALLLAKEEQIRELQQENTQLKQCIEQQKKASQKNYENYETILQQANQQKAELEKAMRRLQESNEEMEMQRNYLEATVNELEQTLKQLQESNEEMEMQRRYLEETIKELDKTHSNLSASINYAQRIQKALLPSFTHLQQYLPNSFVLLKPKDIVSGDFYWYSIQGNQIIIAAVDCTGHGVPGALMSIIGHSLLEKIVNILKIFSPERILQALNLSLNTMLNQDETHNKDGMDLAICKIDLKNKTLEYAGARNPLIFFQEGCMQVIKADRISIGGWNHHQHYSFTKHSFVLDKPTTIYMFSDGFADQFGGKSTGGETKRLGSTKFREILASLQQYPIHQHADLLQDILREWKMGYPQIDDILVIGLQID
ncbi:MAG: SpoIIE family protein phosphatase [Cytophagales bacterium]|nr:SpoIIE family protein phosphatase [Cytophagales bacterium]